jgi:hypothetical protein
MNSVVYLLSMSVVTLAAQSIRNTSLELNVLHAPSSGDQLRDTRRPHQKVSRRKVVTIAHVVKMDTAYSALRSHGIVCGIRRKYNARIASLGK